MRFNKKLAFMLAHRGLIKKEDVAKILAASARDERHLDEFLLAQQQISEDALVGCVAIESGLALVDLRRYEPSPDALESITPELSEYYQALPLARVRKTLTLALANPYDVLALDDIKVITGLEVHPVVSTGPRIEACIRRHYKGETPEETEHLQRRGTEIRRLPDPDSTRLLWPTLDRANEQLESLLRTSGAVSTAALDMAVEVGTPDVGLGERLVDMGAIEQDDMAEILVRWRGAPFLDPGRHDLDPRAVESVPDAAARRYGLVPLDRMGEVLTVASCHHLDETIRRVIEKHAGCRLALTVATVAQVRTYHGQTEDATSVPTPTP